MRLLILASLPVVGLVIGCHPAPTPVEHASSATPAPAASPEAQSTGGAPAMPATVGADPGGAGRGTALAPKPGHELAAFAAGCFWGVEDAFRKVPGVTATTVGYTGGHTDAPTYESVCTHTTGHAETVLVEFDPAAVGYERLVRIFFAIHDPTTKNRQGPDVGDQYRSAVFTFGDAQAKAARSVMEAAQKEHGGRIVTEITPMARFWIAEDYHQQYAEKTGYHGCPIKSFEGI